MTLRQGVRKGEVPVRTGLRSHSHERCSTATSGVYSASESEGSVNADHSTISHPVSRIPPPKPSRTNIHNHAYSRSYSDGNQTLRNTKIPKPKIPTSKKKATSYMNL